MIPNISSTGTTYNDSYRNQDITKCVIISKQASGENTFFGITPTIFFQKQETITIPTLFLDVCKRLIRSSGNKFSVEDINLLLSYYIPKEDIKIVSTNQLIEALKKYMGFNISEIAAILHVERPTIYEWLSSKETKLRKGNQQRLDHISKYCEYWQKSGLNPPIFFLRKPIFNNLSLFDLLSQKKLDHDQILKHLKTIETEMRKSDIEKIQRAEFLQEHGFTKIREDRIRDALSKHNSIG